MPEAVEDNNDETKENVTHERKIFRNYVSICQLSLKIVELIFCIVCVALLSEPAQETFFAIKVNFHYVILAYSSFASYILINLVLIIGRILNEPIGLRTSLLFSMVGAGLFFVTAILLFVDQPNLENYIFYPRDYVRNLWTASASFALINAIVFVIDTIYTFLKRDSF